MDDTLPLYPLPPRDSRAFQHSRSPSRIAPAPLELHSGFERERSALTDYWRRLCDELEAVDRRLDELDALLAGW
jgi:hypothetical protein